MTMLPRPSGRSGKTSLFLLASALASVGGFASTPDLVTLFPRQAELFTEADGLSRLELTPAVIEACRGDLSDLRVFDPDGREVPFLVDGGLPPDVRFEVRRRVAAKLLDVSRETLEAAAGGRRARESYEIAAPPASPTGYWDLVVEARRSSFVRAVKVEAREPDGASRVLIEGSVFRLADPAREKTRLALPAFEGALVVTFEGEGGVYLDPALRFESARSLPALGRAEVELEEVSLRSAGRRTLLEVARPRGLVPDALVLATSTAAFNRPVEVWDEGPGAVEPALGREVVFRVPATAAVESLEIPLRPARGDRLRLVVDDGDSPPLEDLSVRARVRRPALVFSLPPRPEGPAGMLRFGGGRAFRPRYDLTVLGAVPAAGTAAEVAGRLYDPASLGEARLGAVSANPRFDPTPALAFAHLAGSEVERRAYRHRRRLEVVPSAEGLASYRLTPEDLGVAREDLADLRIVDGEGRQRAYLLERGAHDLRPLAVAPPVTEERASCYALTPPVAPAVVDRIVVETPAPFFDRAYELTARLGDDDLALVRGRLTRRLGDPRPVEIAFAARRLDALELRVEDGDDAPLPLAAAIARLAVAELYFAVPAGTYWLLLGQPDDAPPRYELARLRDVVLAVAASPADAGALEENPDFRARSRLASEEGLQQVLLWSALAAAVAVLALLTLRLARRGGGTGEADG